MKKAKFFKKLSKNLVQCSACHHYCQISEGKTGICGVRQNCNGKLLSLVYGKTTGLAIDPIEKKPLFHFLPGSTAMSFGTLGCNFGCEFCQNAWASQSPKELRSDIGGIKLLIDKLSVEAPPSLIVNSALQNGCQSVAYTYNEPAVFIEYAYDAMVLAKQAGLKNVFVSNGYESKKTLHLIKVYLDAINIDLKSFREDFYQKICKAKLKPVLENIKKFHQAGIWTEVTTLIIPGENDSEKELKNIAKFLAGISKNIPWHISAFSPEYKMRDKLQTPEKTLLKAYEIGKSTGLNYIYVGNVWNLEDEYFSTYCPKCGELLIRRDAYRTAGLVNLKNGKCGKCEAKILGIWHN